MSDVSCGILPMLRQVASLFKNQPDTQNWREAYLTEKSKHKIRPFRFVRLVRLVKKSFDSNDFSFNWEKYVAY